MNRKLHIEFLRILAIFFVIFNHTGPDGYRLYTTTISDGFTIKYIFYASLSVFCKIAVPLFFMISGALLLKKEETYQDLFQKRVSRIVLVLILISSFYYISISLDYHIFAFSITEFLTLFSYRVITPLWYLYAYLGFLLCLPFLRKIALNMQEKDFHYLFIVMLILGLVRLVIAGTTSIWFNSDTMGFLLDNIFYYPIMGYYIENKLDMKKISIKTIGLSTISTLLFALFDVLFNYLLIKNTGDLSTQAFLGDFSLIIAVNIYFLTKYIFEKIDVPRQIAKIIISVGSCTFGMYLLDEFLRTEIFYPVYYELFPVIKRMPACFVGIIACMTGGYVIIYLLKLTPFGKKLL